jgi:hypothetical protein
MKVSEIQTGLLAAIAGAGLTLKTLRGLSTRDIREKSGDVVVIAPAVLVVYTGSAVSARNLTNTLYSDPSQWEVLVVAEDLSGGTKPAEAALAMIDVLLLKLGGLNLTAASGRGNVELTAIEPVRFENGLAQYVILLTVESDFQTAP